MNGEGKRREGTYRSSRRGRSWLGGRQHSLHAIETKRARLCQISSGDSRRGRVHYPLGGSARFHSFTVATLAMSQTLSTAVASSRFQAIFNAALKLYEKQTKKDLIAHPLASQLQTCDSPTAILSVLQEKAREFDRARSGDERLTKWLNPTVNVLYAFSAALGEGVGLVCVST